MKNTFWIVLILAGFLLPFPVLGDEGIPFSGNHTVDLLSMLTRDIPDNLTYIPDQALKNPDFLNLTSALTLGKAYLKSGDALEAEECFARAIESDSQSGEAWKGLFVSLTLQEKYDQLLNRSSDRIN
ncbi:MAG: hypothetical protein LUQ07_07145, partial [Methanospirillum sp.]|nr:hypothetical protein [Methanospirillum sp.]